MAISTSDIQALYIAYFNRPADFLGLTFWQNAANAAGSVEVVANEFSKSPEYTELYAGKSTVEIIDTIYMNLFGRHAEPDGLQFWGSALQRGVINVGNAAYNIFKGAQNEDKVAVEAKVAAAEAFYAALDTGPEIVAYSGEAANNVVKAWMSTIVDQDSLDAATTEEALGDLTQSVIDAHDNATGEAFTLTTGADNLLGTSGADTFNAVEAAGPLSTWTVGDKINGGNGNDTLIITQTAAIAQPLSTTVTSIENVTATSGGSVTLDTTTWTGATNVTATGVATASLTAAATTNVTGTFSGATAADGSIAVSGGKDVNLTVTGTANVAADAGAEIDVSDAAGAVTVTNTLTGADTAVQADVAVTGGASITVVEKLANAVNTTNTHGAVTVTGGATTTTVTVTQDAAATAAATVVGKVNGVVTVADANAGSATAAGTLATVTLNNYANSTIDSSALATVNLTGTGGTLGVSRGALTATPSANTLTLNVNGLTGGAITDAEAGADDGFTKVVVNGTTAASTIADINFGDATAIEVTGDKQVTFTANSAIANVATITVTNTGGSSFGTALAAGVTFTGGAGADTVTLSNAFTKAINMGAGNDKVTYSGAAGTGGSVVAGDGTDTIVMSAAEADAADANATFNSTFSGFEVLDVETGATATTINLAGINGVNQVVTRGVAAANTLTLNGFATGGTLTLDAAAANAATSVVAANVTNAVLTANDTFNVKLSNSTTGTIAFGAVTLDGIETVNITTVDAGSASAATIDSAVLSATAATSIVVSGNNGLTLTNTGNTAVTSFNASGVVANNSSDTAANLAVTFVSANTTGTATVTITGGAGNDTLTGNAAKDTIVGGAGGDLITGGVGVDTITVGSGRDVVAYASVDAGATDSSTANFDTITGFKLAEAITSATNLSDRTNLLSSTAGGADMTVLSLDMTDNGAVDQAITLEGAGTGNGQAVGVTYTVSSKGILTLSGTGASSVDTLGEWLTEAAAVAATNGDVLAFEFGGDTYVFGQNGSADLLVKLVGVTGATGLVEGVAATTAAAGSIVFWDIA